MSPAQLRLPLLERFSNRLPIIYWSQLSKEGLEDIYYCRGGYLFWYPTRTLRIPLAINILAASKAFPLVERSLSTIPSGSHSSRIAWLFLGPLTTYRR